MDGSVKEIINIANKFNIITILDSYGTAFKTALSEKPFCVKQNRKEAESYFGFSLSKQVKILDAIERLHKKDVKLVILTSGEEWVYAGFNGYVWKLNSPKVKTVNPTGSGDAMAGSIALDLLSCNINSLSPDQIEVILAKSVAAGAANAMVWLPCHITRQMVNKLIPKVKVEQINRK